MRNAAAPQLQQNYLENEKRRIKMALGQKHNELLDVCTSTLLDTFISKYCLVNSVSEITN
jgi:hypothetical protein